MKMKAMINYTYEHRWNNQIDCVEQRLSPQNELVGDIGIRGMTATAHVELEMTDRSQRD